MSNYCKKLCVLKQLSSGFASDGKKVSGLLTAEQYGTRLTACFSLINFAPLAEGRYVAVISDTHGACEFFDLNIHGGTMKRNSELNLEDGFCCLICHVAMRAAATAFGKSGEEVYDVKKLCAAVEAKERGAATARDLPAAENASAKATVIPPIIPPVPQPGPLPGTPPIVPPGVPPEPDEETRKRAAQNAYDDEIVVTENYYEYADADLKNLKIITEKENDKQRTEADQNPYLRRTDEDCAKETACGEDAGKNEDAVRLFKIENGKDGLPPYYEKVKDELNDLFEKYPAEENLEKAVEHSRWVRIEFAPQKYYTVGVLYENSLPRYICYGVPADNKNEPPAALKGYCSYLPLSLFDLRGKGYWMMYQDAYNGKCVEIATV